MLFRSLLSPKKAHPMDVIVLTPREVQERLTRKDPFTQEVMKDGVVLYENDV